MSIATNSYDKVPYLSRAFTQTHPDRLAAIGSLLGLRPAPVEKCRVFEIGCASGGNLIPMAEQLPHSSFVGIDLSARQVIEGQDLIRDSGLGNIQIHHLDILDAGDDLGTFDYIICHGVFSWVPEAARNKIFSICKRSLNPDGIAYISYNTLPGWHMRGVIRDMMLFHVRQFPQPEEQIRQARGILDFFVRSVSNQNNAYGAFLRSELELLRNVSDSYLFHEQLETHNTPMYFAEFSRQAESHGLRFLAEADLRLNVTANFPKEVHETLQRLSTGHVYLEQYMDFIRNSAFRQSLLCHADRQPNYALTPDVMAKFHIASPIRPKTPRPNLHTNQPEAFISDSNVSATVQDPIVKSALMILAEEWPKRISFHALRHRARARLEPRPVQDSGAVARDAEVLGMAFLQFYTTAGQSLLELSLRPLPAASATSERPLVGNINRRLAAAGKAVTNLRHESIALGEFERHMLQFLDGTHDRSAIRRALTQLVRDGKLTVQKDGQNVQDEQQLTSLIDEAINQQLARFARQSMLLEQPAT